MSENLGCAGSLQALGTRTDSPCRRENLMGVFFKYEKLPFFCFNCGRIIHGSGGCPMRLQQQVNATGGEAQWGGWLRADES